MKNLILALSVLVTSFSFANDNHVLAKEKIDASKAFHKIELGTFTNIVPVNLVQIMLDLNGVQPVKAENGTAYFTAPYQDEQSAAKDLPKLQSLGFTGAKHVVEYKKNFYPVREFNYYLEKGKVDNTKPPVVRIWK